jgi:hypothetical protein
MSLPHLTRLNTLSFPVLVHSLTTPRFANPQHLTPAKLTSLLPNVQEFEEEMEGMQEKAKKQQAPPQDGMESKEQGQEEGEGEGEAGEDAEAQQGEAGGSAEAPVSRRGCFTIDNSS